MTKSTTKREERRLAVQAELDAAKEQAERNRMGQFATPTELAVQILEYARGQLNETEAVRFIGPSHRDRLILLGTAQGLPGRPPDTRRRLRSRPPLRRTCGEAMEGYDAGYPLGGLYTGRTPIRQREVQPVGLQPALCPPSPHR